MEVVKRVLMLSWEYPPRIIGGLSRVVAELSRQMQGLDWEVHVVTADHPSCAEHEVDQGVHVHRVKNQTDTTPDFLTWVNQLNFGLLQLAIQLQRSKPFSIVHAHDWMVTDAAWVMKTGFGLPLLATMHATEAGRMHGIHNDLQRYIHQMEWRLTFESWEVIVNSQHMHSELQRLFGLPANKMVVIPNGTNPDLFSFQFDHDGMRRQYASPAERIVLYVGRMVQEKGVQVLLDAAPAILASCPGTRFLLIGSGYFLDHLKYQAQCLGIADRVTFLGYVSDHELLRYYKIADVVCIPSLYEPFGIVALESMAADVPVVTSDAGGLTDFVEHMKTGVTTYAGDSGSLAWGVLEVLRNPKLADELKQVAHQKVINIYNWSVIARRTLEVYETVLSESRLMGKGGVPAAERTLIQPSLSSVPLPPAIGP